MPSLRNFKPFWSMSCPRCQRRDQRTQSFLRPANGLIKFKLIRLKSTEPISESFQLGSKFFPHGKSHVHQRRMINYMFEGRLHPGRKGCQISKLCGGGKCEPPTKCSTEISPKTQRYQIRFETVTKKTPKKTNKQKIHQSLTNKARKPIFDVESFLIGA